ncbi:hypothetical protein BC829DRAFT_421774 [Chytridium lagenaria]|nr:hypothetical protein BC829DRAFT_421774 [Chytridium lagenaria]
MASFFGSSKRTSSVTVKTLERKEDEVGGGGGKVERSGDKEEGGVNDVGGRVLGRILGMVAWREGRGVEDVLGRWRDLVAECKERGWEEEVVLESKDTSEATMTTTRTTTTTTTESFWFASEVKTEDVAMAWERFSPAWFGRDGKVVEEEAEEGWQEDEDSGTKDDLWGGWGGCHVVGGKGVLFNGVSCWVGECGVGAKGTGEREGWSGTMSSVGRQSRRWRRWGGERMGRLAGCRRHVDHFSGGVDGSPGWEAEGSPSGVSATSSTTSSERGVGWGLGCVWGECRSLRLLPMLVDGRHRRQRRRFCRTTTIAPVLRHVELPRQLARISDHARTGYVPLNTWRPSGVGSGEMHRMYRADGVGRECEGVMGVATRRGSAPSTCGAGEEGVGGRGRATDGRWSRPGGEARSLGPRRNASVVSTRTVGTGVVMPEVELDAGAGDSSATLCGRRLVVAFDAQEVGGAAVAAAAVSALGGTFSMGGSPPASPSTPTAPNGGGFPFPWRGMAALSNGEAGNGGGSPLVCAYDVGEDAVPGAARHRARETVLHARGGDEACVVRIRRGRDGRGYGGAVGMIGGGADEEVVDLDEDEDDGVGVIDFGRRIWDLEKVGECVVWEVMVPVDGGVKIGARASDDGRMLFVWTEGSLMMSVGSGGSSFFGRGLSTWGVGGEWGWGCGGIMIGSGMRGNDPGGRRRRWGGGGGEVDLWFGMFLFFRDLWFGLLL